MSLANIEVIGSDGMSMFIILFLCRFINDNKGCPYVQRVVSVLIEKNIPFSYLNVDLKNKPAWFLEKSPLGKVPVVRFPDGKIVFESVSIFFFFFFLSLFSKINTILNKFKLVLLELIEDIHPGLTPADPVVKAHV